MAYVNIDDSSHRPPTAQVNDYINNGVEKRTPAVDARLDRYKVKILYALKQHQRYVDGKRLSDRLFIRALQNILQAAIDDHIESTGVKKRRKSSKTGPRVKKLLNAILKPMEDELRKSRYIADCTPKTDGRPALMPFQKPGIRLSPDDEIEHRREVERRKREEAAVREHKRKMKASGWD